MSDLNSLLPLVAIALLLVTLIGGLARVLLGPTRPDRMLAVQLLGTVGVALLMLFASVFERAAFLDVALVLALLAAVSVAALTRREQRDD